MSTDFTTNPFQGMSDAQEVGPEPTVDERADYVEEYHAEEVPSGTTREIIEWVGDDKERAQRALDVEEAKGDSGLKGLKRDLHKMLEG